MKKKAYKELSAADNQAGEISCRRKKHIFHLRNQFDLVDFIIWLYNKTQTLKLSTRRFIELLDLVKPFSYFF